ncbi:Aste57867_6929 [Aphanomyces stellatus]|uniref:Aste57867_6929 protein n=1 Tax=Aphanomyces stellatus TaxID=120398 RepID=A0A485KFW0_9STRA|nr:hypothetical protein As57867_006907 [Aphanomyces stellatus]VFT83881.1 Aste57867_6929 [Aphanomyces stellatus]
MMSFRAFTADMAAVPAHHGSSMSAFGKPMKRKRCDVLDDGPAPKKGLTLQMQASLALLQHVPALQISGSRMGRRGAVDVGDYMVHALGSVLNTAAQVTPIVTPHKKNPSKEDEDRPCAKSS